jgi:hypothetical protein
MKILKRYISIIWSWIYERTALWIILFMGITFIIGLNDLSIQSSKIKEGNIECKVSCHPASYEYIQINQDYSCWCYQNETTLTPAILHK